MRFTLDTVGTTTWPIDRQKRPIYPEGLEELRSDLDKLKGTIEFATVVEELLRTCYYWDTFPYSIDGTCTYKPAAKSVLAVLNASEMRQAYHDAGTKMAHEHGEERAKLGSKFSDFADDPEAPKAPKVGEEKPEGSVDLNALKFPKRL